MKTNPTNTTTHMVETREIPSHIQQHIQQHTQQFVFARLLVDEKWRQSIQSHQRILEILDPNPPRKTEPQIYRYQYSEVEWEEIGRAHV